MRVLVLTTFEDDDLVLAALRAGASGFLGKGVEPVELLDAIRVVAAGEALLSPKATKRPHRSAARPARPTVRASWSATSSTSSPSASARSSRWSARGLTNDEIAAHLFVSPLTAKTHVNRAMAKLGARDRAQLVVVAYQSGLVRAGDLGS